MKVSVKEQGQSGGSTERMIHKDFPLKRDEVPKMFLPVLSLGGKLTSLVIEIFMCLLVVVSHFSPGETESIQCHTVWCPPPWSCEPVGTCQRLSRPSSSLFQLLNLQLWGTSVSMDGDYPILQFSWLPIPLNIIRSEPLLHWNTGRTHWNCSLVITLPFRSELL